MPNDDHDDQCESEYIFPPGAWTNCWCARRVVLTAIFQDDK